MKYSKKKILPLITLLWLMGITSLILLKYVQINSNSSSSQYYPELKVLEKHTTNFLETKKFFADVAQKKGAVYTYDLLKHAKFPANYDLHLLGHVVGEALYKQEGIEGMRYCTDDFRNACSHSIVVGMLLDYGENIFDKIDAACKKAPGGYGAYGLCYHGLGHGILAYENFDFEKAVDLCKKPQRFGGRTGYSQCIGGITMEIIGGGDHDKKTWEKQSEKYLSNANPLSLCEDYSIEKEGKYSCYMYLTPHLFNKAGFNPNTIYDEKAFQEAFTYCDALPQEEIASRKGCFGGFGKEFAVLAVQRDIRNVEAMTNEQLSYILSSCAHAPHKEGNLECLYAAVNSLLWGGENPPMAGVNLCSLISDASDQNKCFHHLFSVVKNSIKNSTYQKHVCELVPSAYTKQCYEKA